MVNDLTNVSGIVESIHPNVSSLKTANYTITTSDYYIGIGVLTGSIMITLPASPSTNDQYVVKDVDGYANIYAITISGNGNNIDGSSTITIAQSYASFTFTYTGSQWSISVGYAGLQNGNGYGLYNSRPVQGQAGRTYYATDQSVFYYDDGNAWNALGPQINTVNLPVVSNYSWVNQGSASATTTGSGIFLQSLGNNSGSISSKLLVQSLPSAPYKISACILYAASVNFASSNGPVGICLRNSSSGKFQAYTVDLDSNGDCVMASTKYDSATSINSVYSSATTDYIAGIVWLQIADNGTNRLCQYSRDGVNYTNFHFVNNADFIIPDQIGIFMDPIYQDIKATITSWIIS